MSPLRCPQQENMEGVTKSQIQHFLQRADSRLEVPSCSSNSPLLCHVMLAPLTFSRVQAIPSY